MLCVINCWNNLQTLGSSDFIDNFSTPLMSNINDTFFDGYYKQIWKTIIPDELTIKEVDFILSFFNLEHGSKVLDLMCGYGRHSIALAKKGLTVTAVDNLGDYIDEIQQTAQRENLPLTAIKADIGTYKSGDFYDLAICMGNSLQFFDEAGVTEILTNTATQLAKGGKLLINSWSVAEIVIKTFQSKSWSQVGELKFLTSSEYHFHPTRLEIVSTIIAPDGSIEEKTAIDYIYSINEMEAMLKKAGFQLQEMYSIPGRKKFTPGEPRIYMVAEKL